MFAARKIKVYTLFVVLAGLAMNDIQAQTIISSSSPTNPATVRKILPKKPKPLSRELSAGYRLNSDGWSIFVDKGYVRSDEGKLSDLFYNLRIIQLELGEHKDARQHKKKYEDIAGNQTKPFVYGKINNFYTFKMGYGFRRMIAGKPEPGTVSIHWFGTGGPALGMEKPYYIEGFAPQDGVGPLVQQTMKYSETNKDYFLDDRYIIGGSGFTKGFDELQFVPGLHVKTGLHFDFAATKKTVLAVETGINAELYSRKIQIMARDEGKQYFVNIFASFQFGKRW